MKRSRFSETQIIGILKEHQAGMPTSDLCHKHGTSDATFNNWRRKRGSMEVADTKRLKVLEAENAKPQKVLAEQMLDVAALKEMLGKASEARCAPQGGGLGHEAERIRPAARLCARGDRPRHVSSATGQAAGH